MVSLLDQIIPSRRRAKVIEDRLRIAAQFRANRNRLRHRRIGCMNTQIFRRRHNMYG